MEYWKFKIINKDNNKTLITIENEDWYKGYMLASMVMQHLCKTLNNFGADYSLFYKANYSTLPDKESGIIF